MYKLFIFEVTRVQALEAGVPACGGGRPGTLYSVVDYDSFSGGHRPQPTRSRSWSRLFLG
jgi:hypothetical protein